MIVFLRNTLQLVARNTTSFCYGLEVPLVVFCWSCWLHGQLSSIDINCHNLKHKIVFVCFHFCKHLTSLTRHCVRMSRVKVKVDFLETIKAFLYRYIKAFTDPKVVVGSIILLISLPYWLMGLPLPCKQH